MKYETNEEHIKFQKEYQVWFYKEYYDAWKENTHDDRRLFCNMYENIMKALDEMKDIESPMIWCGLYKEIDEDREVMNEIKEQFKDEAQTA